MMTNPLSVKKLMKNLILRTLRQLYAMSEIIILIWWVTPPTKVENLQFVFLQFLYTFRRCSSLLYVLSFSCPLQHSVIANSLLFSSKWMWSDPFPLHAILNLVYSQILHVRSIWNPFKIITMSLSAEEFVNETLKFSCLKFRLSPLKPFHIPRQYLSIHPRSPPHSTWVTHVTRMRRVRGTFVQFPRASSFSLRL